MNKTDVLVVCLIGLVITTLGVSFVGLSTEYQLTNYKYIGALNDIDIAWNTIDTQKRLMFTMEDEIADYIQKESNSYEFYQAQYNKIQDEKDQEIAQLKEDLRFTKNLISQISDIQINK